MKMNSVSLYHFVKRLVFPPSLVTFPLPVFSLPPSAEWRVSHAGHATAAGSQPADGAPYRSRPSDPVAVETAHVRYDHVLTHDALRFPFYQQRQNIQKLIPLFIKDHTLLVQSGFYYSNSTICAWHLVSPYFTPSNKRLAC